jgi:acyl-CoA thioester hydrolase
MTFERTFQVGWGDLDANAHMRNTAYLDLSATVRMMYFAENGFPVREFSRIRIGPVIRRDELEYFRESHLLDALRVTLALAGMSEDGSRFRLRNEFFRPDERLAARVTSSGGWLDLATRKLTAPPTGIVRAWEAMSRTDDYVTLDNVSGLSV